MEAKRFERKCEIMGSPFTLSGWEIHVGTLTVKALRSSDADSFGVTFHAGDGDFSTLTGLGAFSTMRKIRPAIEEINRLTNGNWHASCDDLKRERVYRRWLPAEKIKHE